MSSETIKLKIREARLEGGKLILAGKGFERTVSIEDIERVGIEKSFNKVLVVLTDAVAVLTLLSQDLPHLVTLIMMLLITTIYREENIIIKTKYGSMIKVKGLTSKETRRVINDLLSKKIIRL